MRRSLAWFSAPVSFVRTPSRADFIATTFGFRFSVHTAVDTTNHLIVAHEVTNIGTDRSQLATMAQAAKAALRSDNLDVVADRGYFKGEEILACEQAGVAVTLPKPQTSGAKSAGRFGKPDFVYLAKDDVYRCPAGEKLAHH